jgi:exonuclease SbcD
VADDLGGKRYRMRILHTSDWHLGRTFHGHSLHEDQEAFLEWLVKLAQERDVQAVVVAGDVYDRAVPAADTMRLLETTFEAFADAEIPLIVSSGNHDSPIRLGFGGRFHERGGIHLRTTVADLDRPVVLDDADGPVGVYGIPYLLPDAVMADLDAERSHQSVLTAAVKRIRDDASARDLSRTVVLSHAFITGGQGSDSERDIRVGGIADAGADVFEGITYVALGHLHGRQTVTSPFPTTTLAYSGSPLPFSFSERNHTKSVSVVEINRSGEVDIEHVDVPVRRPLGEARGKFAELLARAEGDLAHLADRWVRVILTDPGHVLDAMAQFRAHWPHTVEIGFEPEGGLVHEDVDLDRLRRTTDPVEICASFVHYVGGERPTPAESHVLRDAVEHAHRPEETTSR